MTGPGPDRREPGGEEGSGSPLSGRSSRERSGCEHRETFDLEAQSVCDLVVGGTFDSLYVGVPTEKLVSGCGPPGLRLKL